MNSSAALPLGVDVLVWNAVLCGVVCWFEFEVDADALNWGASGRPAGVGATAGGRARNAEAAELLAKYDMNGEQSSGDERQTTSAHATRRAITTAALVAATLEIRRRPAEIPHCDVVPICVGDEATKPGGFELGPDHAGSKVRLGCDVSDEITEDELTFSAVEDLVERRLSHRAIGAWMEEGLQACVRRTIRQNSIATWAGG